MEREGNIYHVNDVNVYLVYLGRQREGGSPDRKSDLETFSCSVNSSVGVSNVCQINQLPVAVQSTEFVCKMFSFSQDPPCI